MFAFLKNSLIIIAIFLVGVVASFGFFEGSKNLYSSFGSTGQNLVRITSGILASTTSIFKSDEVSAEDIGADENSVTKDTTERYIPLRTINGIATETLEIPSEGKVVVVDLTGMTAYTYEDGILNEAYTVLSKGRPGTAWETPAGEYTIKTKERNHFSSIGEVWMPYSMQFFGNYFIHGWPYYSDGTPVSEGYSGGCIRMSDEDSQKIFEFVDVGTEVIVVADTPPFTKGVYLDKGRGLTSISSDAFIVADVDSGSIIFEKDSTKVMPIASLSKMMTALISLDVINQYNTATVSRSAWGTYGSQGELKVGDRLAIGDLLFPLLLESSNDAAEVLAEYYGRDSFMARMNERAKAIGMFNTSYEDPSGLSYNNISTAEDLFRLTQYIERHKRFIFDTSLLPSKSMNKYLWRNNSRFIDHKWYRGGKNGYTDEAQKTLVTLFDIPFKDEKRTISIILLHGSDTTSDTRKILSYLENNVEFLPNLIVKE